MAVHPPLSGAVIAAAAATTVHQNHYHVSVLRCPVFMIMHLQSNLVRRRKPHEQVRKDREELFRKACASAVSLCPLSVPRRQTSRIRGFANFARQGAWVFVSPTTGSYMQVCA